MSAISTWPRRLALLALLLLLPAAQARAEAGEVRIARNLGIGYLQLYIAEELGLIEQKAQKAGLGPVKVTYLKIGNPSAINETVLSGSADFGASGVPPFLLLYDKTRGGLEVKALVALNAQPAFLNTINPKVKTLADFTDKDRIAVPAVKSALQAILLQMAAEQKFGPEGRNKLDPLTVSLAHPEATLALLTGKTEINSHFTSPPYQYQQLKDPRVHRVLSSYEITGPATFSTLWTSTKFHDQNPKLSRAIVAAIEEANRFIQARPEEAAKIFLKIEKSDLPVEFVRDILVDPDIRFSVAPENITKFSDFMSRVGTIQAKPAGWKDFFFADIHDRVGS